LRAALTGPNPPRRALVVGGGFVGLEAAAVLRTLGLEVVVIEAEERLMPRAVSATLSAFYLELHRRRGVEVKLGTRVTRFGAEAGALRATCSDGSEYAADLVVIGVGVVPNQELAARAGLRCEDGIVVDEFACTEDPDIVAAGDCTRHPSAQLDRGVRLESVHNAMAQALTAAQSLCGKRIPYRQEPWFWSDQYEFKLQMVGFPEGCDREVVRGSFDQGKCSVFYFREGRLRAVDSLNAAGEHVLAKRMLAAGRFPTPEQAGDPGFDLKSVLA
jgi:3-phenylpropionate/trans-cinnamate dioxygenase ferredoxin reductase subunit